MINKLKSWFVVDDGAPEPKKEKSTPPVSKKATVKMTEPASTPPVSKSSQSTPDSTHATKATKATKPDSKFVDILLKAIEANNMEGFDYLEYKQSLQNLSKMDMDEKTRYQSAFAMAKTMGVTPQKLVNSANHYVKVLDTEKNKFGEALANQKQNQIVGKQNELKQMEQGIIEKQKQIEKLTAEIEQHKAALQGKQDAINTAASKVEHTKNSFLYAYNMVMGQIQSDVDNMKKFIS